VEPDRIEFFCGICEKKGRMPKISLPRTEVKITLSLTDKCWRFKGVCSCNYPVDATLEIKRKITLE
jgi:hypothetical protein